MISPDEIRGLSLWQPWASLVALGIKRIETRPYAIAWRGVLAIHATRSIVPEARAAVRRSVVLRQILEQAGLDDLNALPLGGILAVTTVANCYPADQARFDPSVPARELALGYYRRGRFAIALGTVARLREPIPFVGRQRLFHIDDHTIAEIRRRSHKLPEVA